MQQDILINWSPQETRVAVVEHGAVQELHVERTLERGLVGNVYLGKVARVLPGMQSAFIDIGLDRAAFLHVADLMSSINSRHADSDAQAAAGGLAVPAMASLQPIEKQLFEGQAVMVQVLKDPIGTKGARLTAQISIAGRLLVFLPQDNHIGVSQKIPPRQREELRQRVQSLTGDMGGGFILRTNGEDATDAELAEDITYLRKTWARIKDAALRLPPASVLHQDLNLLQRVLRDLVVEGTQTIRIDSREQFEKLKAFAAEFMPATVQKLQHYGGERPIFDLFNIDEEIAKALGRRVDLKSGGYLIRPDRGADHGGRQHRRLRRRAQLRRHHLQDQPGGLTSHRAPTQAAQPGRHRNRRLHRHDPGKPSRRGAGRIPEAAGARPHQDHG
jgi:ribonuclease G